MRAVKHYLTSFLCRLSARSCLEHHVCELSVWSPMELEIASPTCQRHLATSTRLSHDLIVHRALRLASAAAITAPAAGSVLCHSVVLVGRERPRTGTKGFNPQASVIGIVLMCIDAARTATSAQRCLATCHCCTRHRRETEPTERMRRSGGRTQPRDGCRT